MLRSQIKRAFAPEEVEKLLSALGSAPPRASPSGALMFQTICHNPPHQGSHKLYYYADTGLFHCYTHCGDTFDIYELVRRSQGCSFRAALSFVQQTLGVCFEPKVGFAPQRTSDWDILDKYACLKQVSQGSVAPENTPLSESLLAYYPLCTPVEWRREGITSAACQRYGIRFDLSKNEIIIPHRDQQGTLIGIRSRTLDPAQIAAGFKYMPTTLEKMDFRHTLRYNLYGLYEAKAAIQRSKKCLICEGEKSCLQSYAFYGEDSFTVAACGSNISNFQRDLILGLGVKEVFLGFDKEYHEAYTPESDDYADKILKLAGQFSPYVTTYVLYDIQGLLNYKDSPTDRGRDTLERLMKHKFEVETL